MSAETLAPRVLLAFDDFSRAGKHVLRLASSSKTPRPLAALQGFEFGRHVETWTSADDMLSFVVVHSALVPAAQLWEVADALSQAFEDAQVKSVTVFGAVHLPYAKPSSDGGALDGVYYAAVGAATEDEHEPAPGKELLRLRGDWEIKDVFLSSLLHLMVVGSAFRVHLLFAKGYRPGRNLAGTYEAAEALAAGLEMFTRGKIVVDPNDLKLTLPGLLAADPSLHVGNSSTASGISSDASLLYN